ncbi:MAG: hypothetical protein ACTSP5_12600, partial [Candidatus Heimdallarchaeota archaeon]
MTQKENNQIKRKIGIVSFTDPREDVQLISNRENYLKKSHQELVQKLEQKGFTLIDPHRKIEPNQIVWGINKKSQIKNIQNDFTSEDIAAMLFCCWAWNEPNIPI